MMSFKLFTFTTIALAANLVLGRAAFADLIMSENTPAAGDKKSKDPCYQKLMEKCQALGNASSKDLNDGVEAAKALPGTSAQTKGSGAAQTKGAGALKKSAESCQGLAKDCKKVCEKEGKKDPNIITQCEKDLNDLASMFSTNGQGLEKSGMETSSIGDQTAAGDPKADATNAAGTTKGDQTAAPKGKSGGMGDMSSMMPMLAMGAMAAMQAKDKEKDKDEVPLLPPGGALQANGTVDCSKPDAGLYSDCNSYLTTACQQAMSSGAFAGSPTCGAFSSRYCGSGQTNTLSTPYAAGMAMTAPGVAGAAGAMPTMGLAGEGQASTYCQSVMAYGYCQSAGRAGCPSCQNLGRLNSAGCATNASTCLAQTSPEVISQARVTCPDDPIFANPAMIPAVGAPAILGAQPTGGALGGVSILPQSVGGMRASSFDVEGPTSDINGRFGPSVFSTGTQAIRTRCQLGQLNNCP